MQGWYEWLEEKRSAVERRLGRAMLIFPLLALAYGVVSGISMARDHAHSRALMIYLVALVIVSIVFRLWLAFGPKPTGQPVASSSKRQRVKHFIVERPNLVEGLAQQSTQWCVQYIAMFCIPLLYFAHAWGTLALAVLAAAATFSSRLWGVLARRPFCMALLRTFVAVLATSFAFAVLFPKALPYFYPVLAAVAVVFVLPWTVVSERRWPRAGDFAAAMLVIGVVGAQASLNAWIRVPLLSVWLRSPAIGVDIRDRALAERWGPSLPRKDLLAALASGNPICCLTPVISPSGVAVTVTHEWRLDGELVDTIALPAIRGRGDSKEQAFRTYSCKRHLPGVARVQTIGCRALLDGSIYLGDVEVAVEGAPLLLGPTTGSKRKGRRPASEAFKR